MQCKWVCYATNQRHAKKSKQSLKQPKNKKGKKNSESQLAVKSLALTSVLHREEFSHRIFRIFIGDQK